MEEKKQEEIDIIVNQLSEWQSQDDKKRAVMVVAVEKIDDDKCSLTAALKGANGVLLPALIDIQERKEWQILFFSSLLLSKSLP